MPQVFFAKVSSDAGNRLGYGSDSGLYVGPPSVSDVNPGYVVDNSWGASGSTFVYRVGTQSLPGGSVTPINTQGAFQPIMLQKSGKITTLTCWPSTTNTATMYAAIYASNPVTGWPAAKLFDFGSAGSSSQPITINATGAALSAQPLTGRVIYYLCTWFNGTVPTLYARSNTTMAPVRMPAMSTNFNVNHAVLIDNSAGWQALTSAPTTYSVNMAFSTANVNFSPIDFWATIQNS